MLTGGWQRLSPDRGPRPAISRPIATRLDRFRCQHGAACTSSPLVVLALNRWRCPLTPIAARYTDDRRANFDIYLPEWLARHNTEIFGSLYLAGVVLLAVRWVLAGA